MKMTPTARQIAHSPLLSVRTLNIGTIDRLSGNTAWAEAIIERYKPSGETDLPSVDFVYQEMAAQEAAESVTELNTLITTINNIRLNANILNQNYMNRYYLNVQERCELLINRLESNIYVSGNAERIKEIYRDVIRTEYVPVEERIFKERMREAVKAAGLPPVSTGAVSDASGTTVSGMYRSGMTGSGMSRSEMGRSGMDNFGMRVMPYARRIAQLTGRTRTGSEGAGGDLLNDGSPMVQRMPMIRDMRFASEWTSQAARQFFWRVQRAAEAEQEIILQSSGTVSLIYLEKQLRSMNDAQFRHFTEELSTRVRTSIEDAASQVVREERLRKSGIVGRNTAALSRTGQNEDTGFMSENGKEAVTRTGNETFGMDRGENGQTSEDVGYASASDMPDGMSYGDMSGSGAFPEEILTAIKGETTVENTGGTSEHDYPGREAILAYLKGQGSRENQDTGVVNEYVAETLRSMHIVEDNREIAGSIAQRIIDMPMLQWNEFQKGLPGIMKEYPATKNLLTTYFNKVKLIYDRNGLNIPSEDRGGDRQDAPSEDRGGDGLNVPSQDGGMGRTGFPPQETDDGGTGADHERTDESTIRNIRMSAEKSAFLELLQYIHSDGISNMLFTEKQILQSGYLGTDTEEELSKIDRLEAAPELTYRSGNAADELKSLTPEEWHAFTQLLTEAGHRTRSGDGSMSVSRAEAGSGVQAGFGAEAGAGVQEVSRTKADAGLKDMSDGIDGELRKPAGDMITEHQPIAESIAQGILNMSMLKWTELQDILGGIRTEYPETGDVLDTYFDEVHRIHVSRSADTPGESVSGGNMPDADKVDGSVPGGSSPGGNMPDAGSHDISTSDGIWPDQNISAGIASGRNSLSADELERNITMSAEKAALIRLMTGADGTDIYGVLGLERGILQSGIFGDEDVSEELSMVERLRSQPELVYRNVGFEQSHILPGRDADEVSDGTSGMGIKERIWTQMNAAADMDDMLSEISQDMNVHMDVRRYVYAGERNIYSTPYNRFILNETAARSGAVTMTGAAAGAGAGYSGAAGSIQAAGAAGAGMGRTAGRTGTGISAEAPAGEYAQETQEIAQAALEMLRSSRVGMTDEPVHADMRSMTASGMQETDISYAVNLPYVTIYAAGDQTGYMGFADRAGDMESAGQMTDTAAGRRTGPTWNRQTGNAAAGGIVSSLPEYAEPEYADYGIPDIVINAPVRARRDESADTDTERSSETVQRTQETFKDIDFVTRTQTTQEHVIRESQADLKSAIEKLDQHQTEIDKLKASEKQLTRFTDEMTRASIRGDIMRDISSRLRMERLRNGL
jgi:hypothetical protein